MDPSQRKLVVLLIFQFASFIALFYTSIVNVEASFKSKFFISYTSIHDWKLESWIKKMKDSIL